MNVEITPVSKRNQMMFSRWATFACCWTMVGVGALLAAYGPVVPQLRQQFAVSAATSGYALALQSAGAVAGVLAMQPVLHRWGNRCALGVTFALISVGAIAVAVSPEWPVLLAGALIAGLGLGGCDALISQLFVVGQGRRGPALLNVAHACFGVGTVLAPLLIAIIGPSNYPILFALIAALVLTSLPLLRGVVPRPTPADLADDRSSRMPRAAMMTIAAFLVLYIAHFGVQSGIGSWGPTRLIDLGHRPDIANLATSGYWLAMVIGRFAVAPLASRIPLARLVTLSCAGMSAAMLLATLAPHLTTLAYIIAGVCIGPIFPNGISWLLSTGLAHGKVFSYVIAGAMAGSVLLPPLLGILIHNSGSSILAPAVLAVALIATGASLAAARTCLASNGTLS